MTFPNDHGHHAEKQRRRLAAQCATGASKVAAIRAYLDLLAPHRRIAALLALIKSKSPAVFWPAFIDNWSGCDKGSTNRLLPSVLRRVGPAPASYYQNDWDGGDFFRSLPDEVTVYRGASRERIAGLSWTTSPTVAWRFARGHRGILSPDPVVATGTINEADILWATDRRNEQEIIGVPRDIKVEDFPLQQFTAYIGWRIINSILNNLHHDAWSAKDYAFVGLKNVRPITIARAHFLAVERIGYTPEHVWVGKKMEAPVDTNYWAAVLAAVPAAMLGRDGAHFVTWQETTNADALADAHYASLDGDALASYLNQYQED